MLSGTFRSAIPTLRLALGPTLTLALALVLGGCWGGSSPPPLRESVVSHFVLGSPDLIQTTIVDALPVKAAMLKLPGGQMVEATQIDKERNVYTDRGYGYGPNLGVGVAGGSNGVVSSGVGFGFPLFGVGQGGGYRTGSMTTSTVRFKVPDMAAYRRDWQQWVLHIDLDDGANRRSIETLPPAPPQE